jgi:hypothetical protein
MGAHIDLNKCHLIRQHGDLIAAYTWVNDERALILLPAFRKNSGWYVVLESAAFKYDNPEYLARQARIAAEILGMEPSPNNWVKLATVINDGLPDLIEMPSAPATELMRAPIGSMQLRADGKIMGEQDITLERDTGVTYGN